MYELLIFLCKTSLLLLPFVVYLGYLKLYRCRERREVPEVRKLVFGSPALIMVRFADQERYYLTGDGFCHELPWVAEVKEKDSRNPKESIGEEHRANSNTT